MAHIGQKSAFSSIGFIGLIAGDGYFPCAFLHQIFQMFAMLAQLVFNSFAFGDIPGNADTQGLLIDGDIGYQEFNGKGIALSGFTFELR